MEIDEKAPELLEAVENLLARRGVRITAKLKGKAQRNGKGRAAYNGFHGISFVNDVSCNPAVRHHGNGASTLQRFRKKPSLSSARTAPRKPKKEPIISENAFGNRRDQKAEPVFPRPALPSMQTVAFPANSHLKILKNTASMQIFASTRRNIPRIPEPLNIARCGIKVLFFEKFAFTKRFYGLYYIRAINFFRICNMIPYRALTNVMSQDITWSKPVYFLTAITNE